MNKFAAILLLAVASAQLIQAQPIDDEEGFSAVAAAAEADPETASLIGNERLFTDFCHEQRDYVYKDMQDTARGVSSYLFKLFFSQASEIAEDVINVEKQAVDELAQQIQNPDTPVSEEKLSENEISDILAHGKQQIASKADPSYGLLPASFTALKAITNAFDSSLFRSIAKARSYMNVGTLVGAFWVNCRKVAEYEQTIEQRLEQTKAELATTATPEVQSFLNTVTVNSLHCQTSKNVVRLTAFCQLVADGKGPFLKMLGFRS